MPERALLGRLVRRNATFVLVCAVILGGFEFLIAAAVANMHLQVLANQIIGAFPPFAQAVLGPQIMGLFTSSGLLAFGWNHPIVLALGGAVAIVLAARAVAAEVESGAIELVLAQPISRAGYLTTNVLFGLAALAVLTIVGLAGSIGGQHFWGIEAFRPRPALALAFNFWLFHAASFAVALAISTLSREAGRVGAIGFVLLLASFVLQVIGGLWKRLAFLLPWSIYERFSPRTLLMTGHVPGKALLVLGALLLVGLTAAAALFARRDLP